ncbi:MAG: alanine racemase [Clostridia bacterium]
MNYTKYGIGRTDRTWAEISLENLKKNALLAKEKAGGAKLMCVIKADAYGHGAVECSRFLQEKGIADAFAVASVDEATELRENGIELPVLILGFTKPEHATMLSRMDIIQSVLDEDMARDLSANAEELLKVHVQIDTGMSRTGLYAQNDEGVKAAIEAVLRINAMKNIRIEGMFTHLSVADTESETDYTNWQIDNFIKVREGLLARGLKIKTCHVGNSAGILFHKRAHFDMVREGIMLYGLYPDSIHVENGILSPVMTVKSRVAQVKKLAAGTSVSYGRTYKTEHDIESAVILAGYADGYPRRLSNAAKITIDGKTYNQIGRVCMDMIMADVTGGSVKRGDVATLFGSGGMSVEEVAEIVGTINYEITSLVTRRVERIYLKQ